MLYKLKRKTNINHKLALRIRVPLGTKIRKKPTLWSVFLCPTILSGWARVLSGTNRCHFDLNPPGGVRQACNLERRARR